MEIWVGVGVGKTTVGTGIEACTERQTTRHSDNQHRTEQREDRLSKGLINQRTIDQTSEADFIH